MAGQEPHRTRYEKIVERPEQWGLEDRRYRALKKRVRMLHADAALEAHVRQEADEPHASRQQVTEVKQAGEQRVRTFGSRGPAISWYRETRGAVDHPLRAAAGPS